MSNNKNSSVTLMRYFHSLTDKDIKTYTENLKKDFPDMAVLAFVAESDAGKVPELQNIFKSISVPLFGAIFPAIVFDLDFKSQGLLLVCLPNKPVWHLEPHLPQDKTDLSVCLDSMSEFLEKDINEQEDTTLFMIFDAMTPNIATVLDDLYINLGDSVHYTGVNAGSETFQAMPCIFDDTQIVENGMLALLLKNHKGGVLEHGYKAPEETIVATSTKANCITNIDWKPAFDVYRARVKKQFNVEITADNFYKYGVHFPFGIIRADGEVLVRIPVMLGEDNSLYCVGEIPENSILTLLDAPKPESLHTVEKLTTKLSDNPTNLLFYCAGRRMHLKEAANNELKKLGELTKNNLYGGALSLGEIGSSHEGGYPLFHNATLVALPIKINV